MAFIGVLLTIPIATLLVILFVIYRFKNEQTGGKLEISSASVQYDQVKFGSKFDWNKRTFFINEKATPIISGEFHYWRLPDQARWREMLLQYKAAGLNSIRIYFHWGFHSPAQGKYSFDGNKDIDYLLTLCEEVGLYVFAAPGPYICAETQGGGLPSWLIQMRDVRIRHLQFTFHRVYDEKYSMFCGEWFDHVLPIIAKHQITTKSNGCVLAVQLENENFEYLVGIPLGLCDDMRYLAKNARDNGIQVPFFTNDAWEAGSFNIKPSSNETSWWKRLLGFKDGFGLDLYGFDKYVVFGPNSHPSAVVTGSKDNEPSNWKPWDPSAVMSAFDNTEKKCRSFGGGAASSPIFIPELQGGWFNHYTVNNTFDHIYNFFGEGFTNMIVGTALGQGCNAFSIYMFYGGTNWGSIGDPDVYTSYDYSACIREYGLLSGRGRAARLQFIFIKSFYEELSKSENILDRGEIGTAFSLKSTTAKFISMVRRGERINDPHFVFFRNFGDAQRGSSTISLYRRGKEPILMPIRLPYKKAFVALGNYQVGGLQLMLSTAPIYLRFNHKGNECWIVRNDDVVGGVFCFKGNVTASGDVDPIVSNDQDCSIIRFAKQFGSCTITPTDGGNGVTILCLSGNDLKTLTVFWEDDHWDNKKEENTRVSEPAKNPVIFWGSNLITYNAVAKKFEASQSINDEKIFLISDNQIGENFVNDLTFNKFDGLRSLSLTEFKGIEDGGHFSLSPITFNQKFELDFEKLSYVPLMLDKKGEPIQDPVDLCYTSGYSVYKLEFQLESVPNQNLEIKVNSRHSAKFFMNNEHVGNGFTYSLGMYRPGTKNGPELGSFYGWYNISVPSKLLVEGKNIIHAVVENLGLNRTPGPFNDTRNRRGLLGLKCEAIKSIEWSISGCDVRNLEDVFNHSGLIVEKDFQDLTPTPNPPVSMQPTWYKGSFDLKRGEDITAPICLKFSGDGDCHFYINGLFVGRYFGGGRGPQTHFYVPDGVLKASNTIEVFVIGKVEVAADLWKIDSLVGSGNVDEVGQPFILKKIAIN